MKHGKYGRGAVAATTNQPLDQFRPFRDRNVSGISVACPQCRVDVGQRCQRTDGEVSSTTHQSRRIMALRAEVR